MSSHLKLLSFYIYNVTRLQGFVKGLSEMFPTNHLAGET